MTEVGAPERFIVQDESSANWVLRKLAENGDQLSRLEAMYAAESEALTARFAHIRQPFAHAIEFFHAAYDAEMETWVRKTIGDGKRRSIGLLHGTIGLRKSPSRRVVDDECGTLTYAEAYCLDAIKHSVLVSRFTDEDMSELSSRGAAHVEPGEEKFYVKAELPLTRAESEA